MCSCNPSPLWAPRPVRTTGPEVRTPRTLVSSGRRLASGWHASRRRRWGTDGVWRWSLWADMGPECGNTFRPVTSPLMTRLQTKNVPFILVPLIHNQSSPAAWQEEQEAELVLLLLLSWHQGSATEKQWRHMTSRTELFSNMRTWEQRWAPEIPQNFHTWWRTCVSQQTFQACLQAARTTKQRRRVPQAGRRRLSNLTGQRSL